MHNAAKSSLVSNTSGRQPKQEPTTPQARSDSHLVVPVISPIPRHRLSPVLDEFSLRRTPNRGGTASPAPAKGVRKRLHLYRNFDHAVDLIKQSKGVVVLTGAGISTSVGIPDFRSDKGLYSQLSKDLGITEAEEFFSKDYFVQNTEKFFKYVRRVIPEAVPNPDGSFRPTNAAGATKNGRAPVPKFSPTHAFLALLQSKRTLLTNYTQNIDGLEFAAGISPNKFVQCHGSWDTASCMTCGRSSTAKKYLPVVLAGNIPYCKCKLEAEQKSSRRQKKKAGKKRSWDDFDSDHSSDDGTQAPRGLLKPDITFFNERLSGSYGSRLDEDKRKIDLLIIIGTSLKVGPVQDMLYQISPKVPQIFISRERFSGALCNLPGVQVDIELLGDCDLIIEELCRRAGWLKDLESLYWEVGQMRIKGPVTNAARDEAKQGSMFKDVDAPIDDARAQKKPKRQDSQLGSRDFELYVEKDDSARLECTATIADTTAENSLKLPEHSHRGLDYSSIFDVKAEQNPSHDEPRPTNSRKSKPGTDSQAVRLTDSTGSRVKIDLVEGTTHQWRVGRK